jgi:hypothetical protein
MSIKRRTELLSLVDYLWPFWVLALVTLSMWLRP